MTNTILGSHHDTIPRVTSQLSPRVGVVVRVTQGIGAAMGVPEVFEVRELPAEPRACLVMEVTKKLMEAYFQPPPRMETVL